MKKPDWIDLSIVIFISTILLYSCTKKEVPVLTTLEISNITATTATSGGNITDEGSSRIIARGVCWSATAKPSIADNITNDSTGIGSFVSIITGLTHNTTYYIRAYATNSEGTGYGNEMVFTTLEIAFNPNLIYGTITDIDNNIYKTIEIGKQIWMAENLKTTKYKDGEVILLVTDNAAWLNLTTPGYCWCNNNEANKNTYGALYNWYTVNTGKLCPAGWHVPTDAEWTTMENYLIANGFNYDGTTTYNKIAKALAATTLWTASTNTGAVGNTDYPAKRNETGFTALPGVYRLGNGPFGSIGDYGFWWSATENGAWSAWSRFLYYGSSNVYRNLDNKKYGFSVRCVRD